MLSGLGHMHHLSLLMYYDMPRSFIFHVEFHTIYVHMLLGQFFFPTSPISKGHTIKWFCKYQLYYYMYGYTKTGKYWGVDSVFADIHKYLENNNPSVFADIHNYSENNVLFHT